MSPTDEWFNEYLNSRLDYTRKCPACGNHPRKGYIYCNRYCRFSVPFSNETRAKMSAAGKGKPKSSSHCANISAGTSGKPKPWIKGERNANYGNKEQGKPEVREKFLQACAERGQTWTDEHRKAHSEKMLGPTNKMRGKKHSQESKKLMSEAQIEKYKNGDYDFGIYRISSAEKEIKSYLDNIGIDSFTQYHIPGTLFFYDFFIPCFNLLIEYQGDYWHAHPLKFRRGQTINIRGVGAVLVDDIWERDERKRLLAESFGYRLSYIWESDYKEDGMEVVECLIQ